MAHVWFSDINRLRGRLTAKPCRWQCPSRKPPFIYCAFDCVCARQIAAERKREKAADKRAKKKAQDDIAKDKAERVAVGHCC
jgi:hypothetical protein